MTIQAADYVHMGKKKYTLIDVQAGKQIIDCVNLTFPECGDVIEISTACWRGYTANYYVIRKTL